MQPIKFNLIPCVQGGVKTKGGWRLGKHEEGDYGWGQRRSFWKGEGRLKNTEK